MGVWIRKERRGTLRNLAVLVCLTKKKPYLLAKFAGDNTAWFKVEYGHIFVYFSLKATKNAQEILNNDPGLLCICSCLLTGVHLGLQHTTFGSCVTEIP